MPHKVREDSEFKKEKSGDADVKKEDRGQGRAGGDIRKGPQRYESGECLTEYGSED